MIGVPSQYLKQYLEGEQAAFDEEPHSCRYTVGSEEGYWWNRGYEGGEDLNEELARLASAPKAGIKD